MRRRAKAIRGVRRPKPVVVTRADGTRYVRRPRPVGPAGYGGYAQPGVSYGEPTSVDNGYAEPTAYAEPTVGGRPGGRWFRRNGHIVLVGV